MTTSSTGYLCPQCGHNCRADYYKSTAVYLLTCGDETCPTHRLAAYGARGTIRGAFEDYTAECEAAGLTAWADAAARDALHRGALS